MGYRLRIHNRVRDWLTDLRGTEPEAARVVGEAVLAMLEAGESLGPPVVLPLESVLRSPDDPREALDYSYERQLEMLQRVRRGVADVATSRKRVELQVSRLGQSAAKLVRQAQDALDAGWEDLARDAQTREAAVREQLSELRDQLAALRGEEERLTAASQRLQGKVDAFRTRKETIKASAIPPGLMELRPGAPDRLRTGLLFAVEPQDTAVLLAWVEDPGRSPDEYQEVIRLAASRLAMAQDGAAPVAEASPGVFIAYDAESFLDEFFPGEETEVEIGAAALAARHRAHTLAQARQRMRLTQAQVAARMNVRQERVSAIERAAPGATEVRTLAAYVRALGGRLEIIADIDGERVVLR